MRIVAFVTEPAVVRRILAHPACSYPFTALAKGTLTVRVSGGETQRWSVSGGFFEVSNNRATVLADGVEAEAAKGWSRARHRAPSQLQRRLAVPRASVTRAK